MSTVGILMFFLWTPEAKKKPEKNTIPLLQGANHWFPRTQLTSIFEGQPLKTRPFRTKTRVIWVLGSLNKALYFILFLRGVTLGCPGWSVFPPPSASWVVMPPPIVALDQSRALIRSWGRGGRKVVEISEISKYFLQLSFPGRCFTNGVPLGSLGSKVRISRL